MKSTNRRSLTLVATRHEKLVWLVHNMQPPFVGVTLDGSETGVVNAVSSYVIYPGAQTYRKSGSENSYHRLVRPGGPIPSNGCPPYNINVGIYGSAGTYSSKVISISDNNGFTSTETNIKVVENQDFYSGPSGISYMWGYEDGETSSILLPMWAHSTLVTPQTMPRSGKEYELDVHSNPTFSSSIKQLGLKNDYRPTVTRNTVASSALDDGFAYITSNTGPYLTQLVPYANGVFHRSYSYQLATCTHQPDMGIHHTHGNIPPNFQNPFGTVIESHEGSRTMRHVPIPNPSKVSNPDVSWGLIQDVALLDGHFQSGRSITYIDAFVVQKHAVGAGNDNCLALRWFKPSPDDMYPQHGGAYLPNYNNGGAKEWFTDQGTPLNARRENGSYTAMSQCYMEAPGRLVIGHWVTKANKWLKAVYIVAENRIERAECEDVFLYQHFVRHKIDQGKLQRFTVNGQNYTVMFPGWGAAEEECPWVDREFGTYGTLQNPSEATGADLFRNRAFSEIEAGTPVPKDGKGAPWLVVWNGHDVRVAPSFVFNMGNLFMVEQEFVHRIDATGFLVKGTSIAGASHTWVAAESSYIKASAGITQQPLREPACGWGLSIKGGVGDKSAILVDVEHLFSNDPSRAISIEPKGRLFPVKINVPMLVKPHPDQRLHDAGWRRNELVTISLNITKPGIYEVTTGDNDISLDGRRGLWWMRLYKGDTQVMPVPELDPPRPPGTLTDTFCWFLGGRFRVRPGEEGVYTLKVACGLDRNGAYQGSQHGGIRRMMNDFNPSTGQDIGQARVAYLQSLGDVIIPLRFGVAQ